MSVNAVNNLIKSDSNNQLRDKAAEVVSNLFYGTLLKEFRESSQETFFSGGFGGKAFQQQMDNVYITELSKQESNQIVDAIVRQLGGQVENNTMSLTEIQRANSAYNNQSQVSGVQSSMLNVIS